MITGDMDRERAETYLRLLAEAELRRATTMAARSSSGRWPSARLALAARALSAVGAVGAGVADQIQADVGLAVAVRHGLPARGPGPDRIRLTSQRRPWRVVPVGQVIQIRDGDLRREVLVMAYAQSADGALLIAVGWPFRPFTAADDRGVRYLISWQVGPAVTQLPLQPDPPRQIRWLDLSTAAGEPATRIDLDRHIPVPDVTVTPAAHSPGELLLDVIAARILGLVTPLPQDNPGALMPADADLRAFVGDGPGQIVAALHAAGVLPPDSPAPGQLAGLCARLGIDGHGITAPPDQDLPERWQSILTHLAAASRGHHPRPASWPLPWPSCPSWTAPRSRSSACITASVAPSCTYWSAASRWRRSGHTPGESGRCRCCGYATATAAGTPLT